MSQYSWKLFDMSVPRPISLLAAYIGIDKNELTMSICLELKKICVLCVTICSSFRSP